MDTKICQRRDEKSPTHQPPAYQPPVVTTYTATELLELIGPVQAGSDVSPNDNLLDPGNPGGTGYYAPEDEMGLRIV